MSDMSSLCNMEIYILFHIRPTSWHNLDIDIFHTNFTVVGRIQKYIYQSIRLKTFIKGIHLFKKLKQNNNMKKQYEILL